MHDNVTSPPRNLDLGTRLVILFGGFGSQFGWLFFGFGMIFFWIFVADSEIMHLNFLVDWQETEGQILSVEYTNASENDRPVMRYPYRYDFQGQTYQGQAYTTGSLFQQGEQVPVLVDAGDPTHSKIPGTRQGMFGVFVLFVVIFPLIGLGFIAFSFRRNIKALDLIRNGRFTRGTLKSKTMTNTRINKRPVFRYEFEYQTPNGKTHTVVDKTHLTHTLEDEATERLIYAPSDPNHAVMYDSIPNAPEIDAQGFLRPASPLKYTTLVVPFLSIAGHGLYVWFRYFA